MSILKMLLRGIVAGPFPSDKDLAVALGLTLGTVKVYTARLGDKLNVHGRLNLAVWARQHADIFGGK